MKYIFVSEIDFFNLRFVFNKFCLKILLKFEILLSIVYLIMFMNLMVIRKNDKTLTLRWFLEHGII